MQGGGAGGGAVPRPPHSGPIMSATFKICVPLMLCFPSPCCLVWLSVRFATETTDNNNTKNKPNNNLSECDTRIYDANLRERLKEDTGGDGQSEKTRPVTLKIAPASAQPLTSPQHSHTHQPITQSRLVPLGPTKSEMGIFGSSRPGCGPSVLFLQTEKRQLTFPPSVELDLS